MLLQLIRIYYPATLHITQVFIVISNLYSVHSKQDEYVYTILLYIHDPINAQPI